MEKVENSEIAVKDLEIWNKEFDAKEPEKKEQINNGLD